MAEKGSAARQARGKPGQSRPRVIIRTEEVIERAHHGGAWKVAYADFVTAMMAFFLLMWLVNATSEDQRRGIAAYFSPMATAENGFSGSGIVPGSASPVSDGAQIVKQGPVQLAVIAAHAPPGQADDDGAGDAPDAGAPSSLQPNLAGSGATSHTVTPVAAGGDVRAVAEDKSLTETAQQLRDAVTHDPALADSASQMAIDVTPEGLRIQIMDAEHKPMFESGSIIPTPRAQALLRIAARFVARLPERVSIGGYTDASPYRRDQLSNWNLSLQRANAARDVLVGAGLPDTRLSSITGFADRKLLLPADPLSAVNRRIVLTLQRAWQQPASSASP